MRRIVLILFFCGLLLSPTLVSAADWIPIVSCGGAGQDSCTPCHIFDAFKNVIDLVLYGITGPIAAFMIVWAGGLMLLGGGNPKLYGQGKALLSQTLIGVTIILMSWVVTNFLIKSLIQGGQGDSWYEFSCPAGLSAIKPLETALPSGGATPKMPAPTTLVAKYAGVASAWVNGAGGSGTTGTSGRQGTFSGCGVNVKCPAPGNCEALAPALSGRSNSKVLEAIMLNESSCRINPPPSGAGAYGLMQMKPETANRFRDGCDVTQTTTQNGQQSSTDVQITAAWLQSEANVEKIVCVADNFINSLKGACGTEPLNIAAGYNGGPGACERSRDCAELDSCVGGGKMRRWECPWNNAQHTSVNTGYQETRLYAPKVAACTR